jgi:hypothetical protein
VEPPLTLIALYHVASAVSKIANAAVIFMRGIGTIPLHELEEERRHSQLRGHEFLSQARSDAAKQLQREVHQVFVLLREIGSQGGAQEVEQSLCSRPLGERQSGEEVLDDVFQNRAVVAFLAFGRAPFHRRWRREFEPKEKRRAQSLPLHQGIDYLFAARNGIFERARRCAFIFQIDRVFLWLFRKRFSASTQAYHFLSRAATVDKLYQER